MESTSNRVEIAREADRVAAAAAYFLPLDGRTFELDPAKIANIR